MFFGSLVVKACSFEAEDLGLILLWVHYVKLILGISKLILFEYWLQTVYNYPN